MARDRDKRMDEIVDAAVSTIAHHGLPNLRIKDIALKASVSERLVSYYFPDIDELVAASHRKAAEKYYWHRLRKVQHLRDPVAALKALIDSGVPRSRDDAQSRVLYELSVSATRQKRHEKLMTSLYRDEVSLYDRVLRDGVESKAFILTAPVEQLARTFMALEDGLGLQVLAGTDSLSKKQAAEILHTYARAVTGAAI